MNNRAVTLAMTASALMFVALEASSQEVYRWVDENGVVSFGETVPEGVEEFERVTIDPSPPPAPAAPAGADSQVPDAGGAQPNRAVERAPARAAGPASASETSLAQLDQLCESAREAAIAPLRAAAIEECKASPRTEPDYCERFYATYGDAVRLPTGAMRPRMFDDLPACVRAREERSRRAR